jgi:hypothetical protein
MIRIYEVANNMIARQKRVAAFQEIEEQEQEQPRERLHPIVTIGKGVIPVRRGNPQKEHPCPLFKIANNEGQVFI